MPREVGPVAGRTAALGHPVVQPDASGLVLPRLVQDVGLGVHGMTRRRFARQRTLGEQPGLVEPTLVLTGEGEQGDVPPVVAVGRARPSTRSHDSRCTSVTPEKAIVGTAAETARTSRG